MIPKTPTKAMIFLSVVERGLFQRTLLSQKEFSDPPHSISPAPWDISHKKMRL